MTNRSLPKNLTFLNTFYSELLYQRVRSNSQLGRESGWGKVCCRGNEQTSLSGGCVPIYPPAWQACHSVQTTYTSKKQDLQNTQHRSLSQSLSLLTNKGHLSPTHTHCPSPSLPSFPFSLSPQDARQVHQHPSGWEDVWAAEAGVSTEEETVWGPRLPCLRLIPLLQPKRAHQLWMEETWGM